MRTIGAFAAFILLTSGLTAQPTVPRMVRITNTFHPADGQPASSVESVTLSIYRDEQGGSPLWQETQNVAVDSDGRYNLLMGSTVNDGIPVELFSSSEPRWLGVKFNRAGEVEQPRTRLASVPYALKASDAETLGGRPAADFLLAGPTSPASSSAAPTPGTVAKPKAITGMQGYIPVFTDATNDLGDSVMQQANGDIGIGTVPGAGASTVPSLDLRTYPFSQIGMGQTTDYLTFFASDTYGPAIYWDPAKDLRFGKGGAGLYNAFGFTEQMRIQSSTGNVGIGTQSPEVTLDVAGSINMSGMLLSREQVVLSLPSGSETNIATGVFAGSLTGTYNTADGYFAMQANGSYNTALGAETLFSLSGGTNNVGVGYGAGYYLTSGSYNIDILNTGSGGDNGVIRIGTQGTQTQFYAAGVSGATVSGVPVLVNTTTGQLGVASSSRRFKEDIRDMGDSSDGLMRLRPVIFRYKQPFDDGSKPIQYGLIAEEVNEVYPELVAHSADGQIETVKYQVLDSMLLNEVQKQRAEIQQLKQQLAEIKALLATSNAKR